MKEKLKIEISADNLIQIKIAVINLVKELGVLQGKVSRATEETRRKGIEKTISNPKNHTKIAYYQEKTT